MPTSPIISHSSHAKQVKVLILIKNKTNYIETAVEVNNYVKHTMTRLQWPFKYTSAFRFTLTVCFILRGSSSDCISAIDNNSWSPRPQPS